MEYADQNQTETWDENADFKTFGSLNLHVSQKWQTLPTYKIT